MRTGVAGVGPPQNPCAASGRWPRGERLVGRPRHGPPRSLLPVRYHAERRQLAKARREAFITPPTGRNQVWQTDFSELETTAGGTWQFAPVVDYHAKLSLASPASTTKTTHDAISAVEHAITEAERLLDRPLIEDLTDPDTGEITPIRLVSDNGPCYRSGGFAAYITRRPELVHIRTRYRCPETNGVVERYIESAKYECLYRTDITDGLALALELDAYRDIDNRVRPHEAIDFATPLDRYPTETPIPANGAQL